MALCEKHGIEGLILLAEEGINGTIAGRPEDVRAVRAFINSDTHLAAIAHKECPAFEMPFHRMKVRLKREIVTLNVSSIHPLRDTCTYIEPQQWNTLLGDSDVVLVGTAMIMKWLLAVSRCNQPRYTQFQPVSCLA